MSNTAVVDHMDRWLGTPAAADLLGVSQKTLYKLINKGDLAAYKLGRNIRVRESDLQKYLEGQRVVPGSLDHLVADETGANGDEPARTL